MGGTLISAIGVPFLHPRRHELYNRVHRFGSISAPRSWPENLYRTELGNKLGSSTRRYRTIMSELSEIRPVSFTMKALVQAGLAALNNNSRTNPTDRFRTIQRWGRGKLDIIVPRFRGTERCTDTSILSWQPWDSLQAQRRSTRSLLIWRVRCCGRFMRRTEARLTTMMHGRPAHPAIP